MKNSTHDPGRIELYKQTPVKNTFTIIRMTNDFPPSGKKNKKNTTVPHRQKKIDSGPE